MKTHTQSLHYLACTLASAQKLPRHNIIFLFPCWSENETLVFNFPTQPESNLVATLSLSDIVFVAIEPYRPPDVTTLLSALELQFARPQEEGYIPEQARRFCPKESDTSRPPKILGQNIKHKSRKISRFRRR